MLKCHTLCPNFTELPSYYFMCVAMVMVRNGHQDIVLMLNIIPCAIAMC